MNDALFLDTTVAAEMLGVSDDLVRDLIARGELPAAKFGRRNKVPRRAIELVLERAMEGFDPDRVLARLNGSAGTDATGSVPGSSSVPTELVGPESKAPTPPASDAPPGAPTLALVAR